MSDLWDRLKAARDRPVSAEPEAAPSVEAAPEGWSWVTPLVARRSFAFELEPAFWEAVSGQVDTDAWRGTLCFDTETTGLSGGAGTIPFLVGWAQLRPGPVALAEVTQYFLRDMPGETDLVAALDADLRAATALVSFNGASYDLPLLRSRFALAGREFPERPHRDALYPSRRLWKRLLDSCRLSRLEETVLGLRREDDVPGALVPALWFDYLRRGAAADFATPLGGVLRHHAQDVYSLLCLDLFLAAYVPAPQDARWSPTFGAFPPRPSAVAPAAEGLLHPALGDTTPADFWGLLDLRDAPGQRAALEAAWRAQPTEAVGLAWAERLKANRDEVAVAVWRQLWEAYDSYPALVELLKWLEHRDRSPAALLEGLELIAFALKAPFLASTWRVELERRRARLAKALPELDRLHAEGLALGRQGVVGLLVRRPDGRLFAQRRSPTRRLFPGCWDLVGGHVEPGETPRQALERELAEETGWKLGRVVGLRRVVDWESPGERGPVPKRELVVAVTVRSRWDAPRLEPGKATEGRWFGTEDLEILNEHREGTDRYVYDLFREELSRPWP